MKQELTGREHEALHDNVYSNTAREHGCSVHTTRVHGPYSHGTKILSG